MEKSFYRRHRSKIWYGLLIFVMMFSFAVLGPIVQSALIDSQKPYILVDFDNWYGILKSNAYKTCDISPYQPVEITGNPSGKIEKVYMDIVPTDFLPYVHYPYNWNEWWNIFNPNQPFGPTVKNVLTYVTPAMGVGLVVWGVVLWKRGKLKKGLRNLLPHDED
jgi:hypothetical protein